MTRLLLVRHGQSTWNAERRWQGRADPPLSDLGRAQAVEAATRVGAVDGVFASSLRRAHETAEIVAEHVGVGPVIVDDDLQERDVGEWSGLTNEQIHERWPGYLRPPNDERRYDPDMKRRPPGWESDDVLLARAMAALERIAAAHTGDVLVVTHGGLVYAVEHHLGADHARLENLGGRWIDHGAGVWALGDRIPLVDPEHVTVPGTP